MLEANGTLFMDFIFRINIVEHRNSINKNVLLSNANKLLTTKAWKEPQEEVSQKLSRTM